MSPFHLLCVILVAVTFVDNSTQRSTEASLDYVAAVVEYSPSSLGGTDEEIYINNVNNYLAIIENATQQTDVPDIIVFAEAGLVTLFHRVFTEIPSPDDLVVPCTDDSGRYDNLKILSCAAKDNEMYIVINLSEKYLCPAGSSSEYGEPCPAEERLNYNTNVVFDRNGAVVARYRKFNLFGEDGMVAPPQADLAVFDTDFGVKFGLFTCFDLMFDEPAIKLVKQENITDLIFPTAWFSELPFLTAVQAQAGFAYTMDVNFLASGYNEPAGGSSGSGIFAGKSGWSYVMSSEAQTQLIISRVQKKNKGIVGGPQLISTPTKTIQFDTGKATNGIYMKQDDLSAYVSVPIVADHTIKQVCHNRFCCDFEIDADFSSSSRYFYRMIAFDGVRTFSGVTTGGVQICAVVSCTSLEPASCGLTFDDADQAVAATFTLIRVSGEFNAEAAVQYPNTLVPKYQIIPSDGFTFAQHVMGEKHHCEIQLLRQTKILTFGIFGREFTRDGSDVTLPSGKASLIMPSLLLMVTVFILRCVQN